MGANTQVLNGVKYHDQQFGYTTIYANQTYLHMTYYHDSDDQIADQFILQK